jgi:DNA-binding transcriptional ArsR family regulator
LEHTGLSAESWENICCRCGSEVKELPYPGKRACHVTCGPCLYPDNPKCASCEIVGHCRLALEYLRGLKPDGVAKGKYFKEQLMGDETIYHTLDFVNAQQSLAEKVGEEKYIKTLEKTSEERPEFISNPPDLPQTVAISPEKLKEIRQRVRDRNAIILVIEDRGPLTVSEISEILKIEKSKILHHLTALRQFGQVTVISERDNQPVYELTLNLPE